MMTGYENQSTTGRATYTADVPPSVPGLMQLADRISEAARRIGAVSGQLSQVALGIHGPRPQEVGATTQGIKPAADSLRGRIDDLWSEINSLENNLAQLTR